VKKPVWVLFISVRFMVISFELYQVREEGTFFFSPLQKVTRNAAVSEEDGVVVHFCLLPA
jgi:hypothetical protein